MLKIISAPNSVLFAETREVKKIDRPILNFLREMYQALLAARDPVGVGLAAPQVGKSLQIFIAKPTPKSAIQVFINPTIISQKKAELNPNQRSSAEPMRNSASVRDSKKKLEGCLSLPNIWGEVKREPEITVSYLDEKEKLRIRKFSGFIATIIQHEMDHLSGILFPKRVLEQKGTLYKSSKNEKGEDIFEEIEI